MRVLTDVLKYVALTQLFEAVREGQSDDLEFRQFPIATAA